MCFQSETTEEEEPQSENTVRVPIQSIQIDKEDLSNVRLTLHHESEEDKKTQQMPTQLEGKQALKYLSKMGKDFRNNKTRV